MNPGLDLVTFGESMVLFLGERDVPLAHATTFHRSVAGAESNVAIGLARLGLRAGWFGRVGGDTLGSVVVRILRGENVDVSRVVSDHQATTGTLIRDCHGERPIDVVYQRRCSAGSRLAPADVDEAYIRDATSLHVTGITPLLSKSAHAATMAAVETAVAAGRTVSFDPNVRRRLSSVDRMVAVLRQLASDSHIILAGEDEAELITGEAQRERMARWFLNRGAQVVVLKRGRHGAWATDGTSEWTQPAVPVSSVDPVGAGDGFGAGFLAARLRGHDVPTCLRHGSIVAALVVQTPGDYEGLPTAAQRDLASTADHGHVQR